MSSVIHYFMYISRANTALVDEDEITRIATHAKERNQVLNVSGYLYYNGSIFLQYLEGPKDSIDALARSIRLDNRHHIQLEIVLPPSTQRIFPNWTMRYIHSHDFVNEKEERHLQALIRQVGNDSAEWNKTIEMAKSHLIDIQQRKNRITHISPRSV